MCVLPGRSSDYLRQAAAVHRATISAYLLGLVDADMADYWRDQIRRRREPMPEPPMCRPVRPTWARRMMIRRCAGYGSLWRGWPRCCIARMIASMSLRADQRANTCIRTKGTPAGVPFVTR